MARFYGSMKGNRGEATRMGTPGSGFTAHIRGWNVGIQVDLYPNQGEGGKRDTAVVYLTTGSAGQNRTQLFQVVEMEDGPVLFPTDALRAMVKKAKEAK